MMKPGMVGGSSEFSFKTKICNSSKVISDDNSEF